MAPLRGAAGRVKPARGLPLPCCVAASIVGVIAYIDVVTMRFRDVPTDADRQQMRRLSAKILPAKLSKNDPRRARGDTHDFRVWRIFQPRRELLPWLDAKQTTVVRVEIAIDWLTATMAEARAIKKWFRWHHLQRWHRHDSVDVIGTSYTGPKHAPRNVTSYADHSKLAGKPCCHVEIRLNRARTLRRLGIRRASDLLALDVAAVAGRMIKLAELNLARLARTLIGAKRRSGTSDDRDRRAAEILLRALGKRHGRGGLSSISPLQDIVDAVGLRRMRYCLTYFNATSLVPTTLSWPTTSTRKSASSRTTRR
ncbi:MAG TPA: hypothetical protein VJ890_21630 [Vineibacter sp.]|nr:hypothetical protein [Vineibacter sp.]